MQTKDFDYELPEALIAQRPLPDRDGSRLLCLERATGRVEHRNFRDLPTLLGEPSLLVVNDTRVFPARLIGKRPTGGRAELLLLRRLDDGLSPGTTPGKEVWQCLGKPRRKLKPGTELDFQLARGRVLDADAEGLTVELESEQGLRQALDEGGRIPLPPYIRRPDDRDDRHRYQTIFAGDARGSVAAPTAGLHFTEELVRALEAEGHAMTAVTLHVGLGTFLPVRAERLEDHDMHGEWIQVSSEAVEAIEEARSSGRRVFAVGTTVVRALESAARRGKLEPMMGETSLFIMPGHRFHAIDGLITNFHLPRSTLLALVSALAGYDHVMAAYRQAVDMQYRFYSYGDAMLIR